MRTPSSPWPASLVGVMLLGALLVGCGAASSTGSGQSPSGTGSIQAVGAENEYGNVIQQIGGPYVTVQSIMTNPNVDPHTYEASTRDALMVGAAQLVVQNGLGYDSFMNRLESAASAPGRVVLTVASALGYGAGTRNPHLWYDPSTMARLAPIIARDLGRLRPQDKSYFESASNRFVASLEPWSREIRHLKAGFGGASVAVTEPVADYLLQSGGLVVATPWALQAAIMNGVDPSPQDVVLGDNLLAHHQVKVLIYNQQAVDSTTASFLALARAHGVPVVGVYETMPAHYSYQTWMAAETTAIYNALSHGSSTAHLS
ncbi:MAG: metal ABC transporter solute-binding protein, Zn/Mn family [Candidatus Dormibacteria bacterium]